MYTACDGNALLGVNLRLQLHFSNCHYSFCSQRKGKAVGAVTQEKRDDVSLRTGEKSQEVINTRRDDSIYLMLNNILFAVLTKVHTGKEVEARDRNISMRHKQTI